MRISRTMLALSVTATAILAAVTTVWAFNPQPDPPAFGLVSILPDQTIRLNVVCFEHPVNGHAAEPCRGDLMLHDIAGNVVARQSVRLRPGEGAFLDFTGNSRTGVPAVDRLAIDPCWIPADRSGRGIPTVEVFDTASGRTTLVMNPAAPHVSMFRVDLP
jgi:hypothetical protein